jgi:hypothetical protein
MFHWPLILGPKKLERIEYCAEVWSAGPRTGHVLPFARHVPGALQDFFLISNFPHRLLLASRHFRFLDL